MAGKPRGFQLMSPERRQQIASLGGKRAHKLGLAHVWNTETARAAGRKGGTATGRKRKEHNG